MPASSQHQSDEISFFAFKKDLNGYNRETFRSDLTAAISIALLTLPQAMAYALLAGLPLTSGAFAAIYSAMITALFGSSRHLVVGPSNAIALLLQGATAEIIFTYYREADAAAREMIALQVLTQLSFLAGIFQIIAAGFKLGRLVQFVSHSVMVAYVAGTAIAVVVNQLYIFFGISSIAGDFSIYQRAAYLFTHISELHLPTAAIGVVSIALLVTLRRVNKRIPAPLITLLFGILAVHLLYLFSPDGGIITTEGIDQTQWQKVFVVGDQGSFHNLIPSFGLPYLDVKLMNHILPVAFAIALLSIMETVSVSKTIAASSGQRLSMNQDIFGAGIGNLLSAFTFAMPISGSAARSAVNFSLGAKTRMAAILSGALIALILYIFGPLVMHIPLTALAALLIVSSMYIVQPRQFFLCQKATSSDSLVLWTTLLACIFLRLDIAFYIGVVMSITLYLKKAALPQLVEYDLDEKGDLIAQDVSAVHEHKSVRVIKVEGELFFGAADLFQTTLKTIAEDDTSTRVIILQLKNARDIDATVCLALQQLHDYLKGSGRHLIACGITQQIWDVLSDSGMVEQIGKGNLFIFDEKHPHMHMVKAFRRARHLVTLAEVSSQSEEKPSLQPA